MSAREGMVRYFVFSDPASHEKMFWCIIDPFFDPFEKTIGVCLALDLSGLPVGMPMILSRDRIALSDVESMIENQVLKTQPFGSP
ncbi:hypothetical protein [Nocardia bovistercoris]|uniref:Uncharacterized protein n=1 Tax=Nocardia bovistercoris TaxID=2785916 RepID=A0A931IAZ9_9NOCA|nr:hypothetical protein [Nocardia bovistercoris]MBH0777286.1 hypothetical protein [Nocardia bovistercoris]